MMRPTAAQRVRHAFTLIEMLVVISIITMLISMLLPNLGKSRESALRVKCASTLRQIGIAATTYSDGNHGSLPTHFGGGSNPFTTYWINRHNMPKLTRVNLGLLLSIMSTPEAYYDPSIASFPESALSLDGPDNPWNESKGYNPGANDNRLRSSYPARSREVELGIGGGLSNWKLTQYQNKHLYSCFVGVDQWNGGGIINGKILATHNRSGINALFADTSAYWVPMAALEKYRFVNSTTPTAIDMHNWNKIIDSRP